jgi:hypothetical protein
MIFTLERIFNNFECICESRSTNFRITFFNNIIKTNQCTHSLFRCFVAWRRLFRSLTEGEFGLVLTKDSGSNRTLSR